MLGDPGRTRTPNPLLRRQVLYPVELRDRLNALFTLHAVEDQSQNVGDQPKKPLNTTAWAFCKLRWW